LVKGERWQIGFVVTHAPWVPQRRVWAARIKRAIETEQHEGGYQDGPVLIIEDAMRQGIWPTTRRAYLTALMHDPTHIAMLQDDMQTPLFPELPILLHNTRKSMTRTDGRWVRMALGYDASSILPARLVWEFLRWEKEFVDPRYPHDDGRLGLFLHSRSIPAMCLVPPLLKHLAPRDSIDPKNNSRSGRETPVWNADVRGVDWSEGADDPPVDNARSWVGKHARVAVKKINREKAGLGEYAE
jgi:hypothetical protein